MHGPRRGYTHIDCAAAYANEAEVGRGLHSSTSQLNLSAFYGRGDALRGCVGGAQEVSRDIRGYSGILLCKKCLRLSLEVDECKPLEVGDSLGAAMAKGTITRANLFVTSKLWQGLTCMMRRRQYSCNARGRRMRRV